MENQQLLDYIKQHVQKKFSPADIKVALLKAGWPEAQVDEAIKSVSVPVVSQVDTVSAPMVFQASEIVMDIPGAEKTGPSPVIIPEIATSTTLSSIPSSIKHHFKKFFLLPIGEGILILALVGVGVWLSFKNTSIEKQIADMNAQGDTLNTQVQALNNTNTQLSQQLQALQAENTDLNNQLSLFIVSSPAMSTATSTATSTTTSTVPSAPNSITVKGTLGFNASFYSVATNKQIVITVKNSKDKAVDAILKPLLGSVVEIGIVPSAGAYSALVQTVNGAAIAK